MTHRAITGQGACQRQPTSHGRTTSRATSSLFLRTGLRSIRRDRDDASRPMRHLLRLACEEWEVLEPQGCLRWITSEEARRLLDACRESRNANLVDLVEFSLFTGLRRSEALTLTWDPCRPSPWGHPARHHKEQQAAAGSPQPRSRRGPGPPRPARRQTRLRLTELGPLSCGVGERCHAREADRPSLA